MCVFYQFDLERERERERENHRYVIYVHVYVHGTEYPKNMRKYSFGLRFQAIPSTKASSTTFHPSLCSTSLPSPKRKAHIIPRPDPVLWVCYTPAPAHTRPALGWVRSPKGRAQHAGHRHFARSVPSRYFPCAPDWDASNFDEVFAGLYGYLCRRSGLKLDPHLQKKNAMNSAIKNMEPQ